MTAFIKNNPWEGHGGVGHADIVIHSQIPPVSTCRLYSLFTRVICGITIIFFYPAPTQAAPVSVRVFFFHTGIDTKPQHPFWKMQMGSICGLLLSESGWAYWGKFLCAAVRAVRAALCICLTQNDFSLAVCACVLGNCVLTFFFFGVRNVSVLTAFVFVCARATGACVYRRRSHESRSFLSQGRSGGERGNKQADCVRICASVLVKWR